MGNTNQTVLLKKFQKKLANINLKTVDVKLKKQPTHGRAHFTYTLKNREYCLTDSCLRIVDLANPNSFETDKKLYRIWDPQGERFIVSRNRREIYFVDKRGLILIDLKHYLLYILDCEFKDQRLELADVSDAETNPQMNLFLKTSLDEDQRPAGEVFKVIRSGYGKITTRKVIQVQDLGDKEIGSLRLLFFKKSRLFAVLAKSRKFPSKCVFYFYDVRSFRLMKTWTTLSMSFPFTHVKTKKNKILLLSQTEIFLLNFKKMKSKFTTCLPSEQVFFTKDSDFKSIPSRRLRFKQGLTLVKFRVKNLAAGSRIKVIRLKNGDFVLKAEHNALKFYYNITKNSIGLVLRQDLPSELPFFFINNLLNTTPNINVLRKFYLKKLNYKSKNLDFVYHKFFKKISKSYYKRFDTIRYVEGSSKIYFEANRLFDKNIYNKSRKFKETLEYKELYESLYCIQFDLMNNKCVFYRLPLRANDSFWILGRDAKNGTVYIVDRKKRVFRLIEDDEKIEEVNFGFLGEAMPEESPRKGSPAKCKRITRMRSKVYEAKDGDNFAHFIANTNKRNSLRGGFGVTPGSSKFIKIFDSKIVFFDLKSSIVLYNLKAKSREVILATVENKPQLIMHVDKVAEQLVIFSNTMTLRVYDFPSKQLWSYSLPDLLIPFPSALDSTDIWNNYVFSYDQHFTLVDEDLAMEFEFKGPKRFTVNKIPLKVDSHHLQSRTIKVGERILNVVSGECILDLTAGKYVRFDYKKQFSFLKEAKSVNMTFLENLYRVAMKFKQSSYVLFERELDFGWLMRDLGIFDMFEAYSKAVCLVDARFHGKKFRKGEVDIRDGEEHVKEILVGLPRFR